MAGIQEVYALVEKGKAKVIANAVQEALDAGCDPTEILNDGMIKAMDAVGEKFKTVKFCTGNAGSCKSHEKRC